MLREGRPASARKGIQMSSYTVIFRTTAWDDGVCEMARRAQACCASGNFVVAADETEGPVPVTLYPKFIHDDDFSNLSLPKYPKGRVVSWNADFLLYAVREGLVETDYYVMLEYDVLLNCDMDGIIARCAQGGVDFAARDLKYLSETHWSRASVRELSTEPWTALIPFIIVSGRAVDTLLQSRQSMALGLSQGRIRHWPYCETFIPTVMAQQPGMVMSDVGNFVDVDLLRARPVLNLLDPQLNKQGIVAHPVMSGARFIKAVLASEPTGEKSRLEITNDDPTTFRDAFVQAAFGDINNREATRPNRLRHFRMDSSLNDGSSPEGLAVILEEQASQDLLVKAVTAIVHEKVFGLEFGFCNIDAIAGLSASIDASRYATENMANAKRFESGNSLRDFAAYGAPTSGLILEFGVFSGYTINRFAALLPERQLFGFDSFEGLPEAWAGIEKGTFSTKLPAVRENVDLVVGLFDQTLEPFLYDHPDESVALLHVDCDLYSSTRTIFSFLADRIVPGTIIVFDEYLNYPGWREHEYKAFQEFVQARRVTYKYLGLVPSDAQVLVRILDIGRH
jgi:hypothetical protein